MAFIRASSRGTLKFHGGAIKKWLRNDPTIQGETWVAANAVADKAREIYLSSHKGETTATVDWGMSPSPLAAASRKGKRGSKYALYEDSFVPQRSKSGAVVVQNKDLTAHFVEDYYGPMRGAVEALGGSVGDIPSVPFSTGSKSVRLVA